MTDGESPKVKLKLTFLDGSGAIFEFSQMYFQQELRPTLDESVCYFACPDDGDLVTVTTEEDMGAAETAALLLKRNEGLPTCILCGAPLDPVTDIERLEVSEDA